MSNEINKTKLVGNADGLADISPVKQQKTQNPSLFWEQKVKSEVEAHAKTNEYIQELQNILDNADKFIVTGAMQNKQFISFKENDTSTGIVAVKETNKEVNEDVYYIVYGNEYHVGDYGYEQINELFEKIENKCSPQ